MRLRRRLRSPTTPSNRDDRDRDDFDGRERDHHGERDFDHPVCTLIGYLVGAGVAIVLLPILPFVAVLWLVAKLRGEDERGTSTRAEQGDSTRQYDFEST